MHTTSHWRGTAEAGLLKSWCEIASSVVPEWNGYPTCCMENQPPCSVLQWQHNQRRPAERSAGRSKTQWGCVTYLRDCQSSLPRHADVWDFLQVILLLVPVFAAVNRIWAKLRQQVQQWQLSSLPVNLVNGRWAARAAAFGPQAQVERCEVGRWWQDFGWLSYRKVASIDVREDKLALSMPPVWCLYQIHMRWGIIHTEVRLLRIRWAGGSCESSFQKSAAAINQKDQSSVLLLCAFAKESFRLIHPLISDICHMSRQLFTVRSVKARPVLGRGPSQAADSAFIQVFQQAVSTFTGRLSVCGYRPTSSGFSKRLKLSNLGHCQRGPAFHCFATAEVKGRFRMISRTPECARKKATQTWTV